MNRKTGKRIWAMLLTLALLLSALPATVVFATDGGPAIGESGCTHEHDGDCGYVEGAEAQPCTFAHTHNDTCGWAEEVAGAPCSVEAAHEHSAEGENACGYDAETGEGCTFVHTHDDTCGYVEAQDAAPCAVEATHIHDGDCGYAEAVEGAPCNHVCGDACGTMQPLFAPAFLSSDASLLKVAGYTITTTGGTGTDADPIIAAITVPNATASISTAEIVVADAAAVNLYDDAAFSNETAITLSDGANELYIKVTAEDGTEAYYHVIVTRVDGSAPEITTTSLPDGMIDAGYYLVIETTAGNSGLSWTQTGTLPAGLTFNNYSNTANISGTPTETGIFTTTISVEKNGETSAPVEFTLTVTEYSLETVGFGGYQWLVVGNGSVGVAPKADALTLLSRNHVFGTSSFGGNHNYGNSTLQSAMDGAASALSPTNENTLIVPRDFLGNATYNDGSDAVAGVAVSGALFWPLSVNEADGLEMYCLPYGAIWWLRSPGNNTSNAAVVNFNGAVRPDGDNVYFDGYGIRPAFHLNLQSVLFTSAAAGGKSGPVGANLSAAQPPANFYKFTMKTADASFLSLTANTTAQSAAPGGSVTIPYTGAQTGGDKFVSCIITDSGGDVLYYGKLATAANGDAVINIPAGLAAGSYTIKLFNEQINGDNYTDFASTPVEIPLTVTAGGTTTYTITFNANGGSVTPDSATTGTDGKLTSLPTPTRSGYSFNGWFTAATGGTAVTTSTVFTSSDTIYAQWTYTGGGDPGPDPDPSPIYTYRTLRHEATGVTLTGNFTSDAALVVTENALHSKGSCAACDEIRAAGGWVVLYDVSITGSHSGNVELSIPVPSGYNGQTMTVWHCKRNHVEKVTLTASNGHVSGTFSSLSPFAVFATGSNNHNPDTGIPVPQTGDDGGNMGLWIALLSSSLLLGGLAVWQLIRRRRKAARR